MKNSNFEPVWFWGLDPGSISRIIKALLYARSSNPTVVMCLKTSSLHHHQRNIIRKTWHQDQTVNAPSISRYSLSRSFWCLQQISWSLVGKQLRPELLISWIVFWSTWEFKISIFNCTYLIPLRIGERQILVLPI